ncbi:MAG: glycosyltransferase [Dysgonomonas sp.]
MEEILSYFEFTELELIFLLTFGILWLIQVFFYFVYYRKPLVYRKKQMSREIDIHSSLVKPSVSVVIISKNESVSLEKNLPFVLSQDYPDFEVIVVNDGSTDESEEVLRRLEHTNPHLYHTFSPDSRDRKLSMTIGIKATTKDVLLFTEASCKPLSDQWIEQMMEHLTDQTEVVLGYSYYEGDTSFYNRMANFDGLYFSLQYLSKAILKHPYTGTFRNLAFRRKLFFDHKGFSEVLNYDSCEDVFINKVMNKENVTVSLSQDSFTSMVLDSYSLWKNIRVTYKRAENHFKGGRHNIFSVETLSRLLFYLVFVLLLAYGIVLENWAFVGVVGLLFAIRLLIQMIIINKAGKYFKTSTFYWSFILCDILQPFYNWSFGLLSRKKDNQKYRSVHM